MCASAHAKLQLQRVEGVGDEMVTERPDSPTARGEGVSSSEGGRSKAREMRKLRKGEGRIWMDG